jgi:hypothetical protein
MKRLPSVKTLRAVFQHRAPEARAILDFLSRAVGQALVLGTLSPNEMLFVDHPIDHAIVQAMGRVVTERDEALSKLHDARHTVEAVAMLLGLPVTVSEEGLLAVVGVLAAPRPLLTREAVDRISELAVLRYLAEVDRDAAETQVRDFTAAMYEGCEVENG